MESVAVHVYYEGFLGASGIMSGRPVPYSEFHIFLVDLLFLLVSDRAKEQIDKWVKVRNIIIGWS